MLSRFRIHLLSAFAAIILLASCSKTNKQGRYIPKDAAVVFHINGESLNNKLPWDDIKGNVLFQELYLDSTTPAFAKKIMDNPDNSGVDIKKDLFLFGQIDTIGGYAVFSGTIKDAEKFHSFNLEISEGGGTETKDGENSYISKAPVCVGWNKERFFYVVDMPEMNMGSRRHRFDDDYTAPKSRDLGAACRSLFALKESNSLGDNEKFTDLMKKEGDLHAWVNSEELQGSMMGSNPMMAGLNLGKFYKDSYTTATANFDKGQIKIDLKNYLSDAFKDIFSKYSGDNINEEMIRHLPAKDVAAVFAFNFNPKIISAFLKEMGIEGLANMGLASFGITMDDFVKANKGDFVFAISDFKPVVDSTMDYDPASGKFQQVARTKTEPDFLFSSSIGDKASFEKLLTAGEKMMHRGGDGMSATNYNTNDKYFAIASSKDLVTQYLAGSANNKYDFLDKINKGPIGGYVNIQLIMKAMSGEVSKDSTEIQMYNASLALWDNAYLKGGKYSGGAIEQNIEINLMDKNTNSLKQLNQYFGKLAKLKVDEEKKWRTVTMTDSVVNVPTIQAPVEEKIKVN